VTSDFPWNNPPTTGLVWKENKNFNESFDDLSDKNNKESLQQKQQQ